MTPATSSTNKKLPEHLIATKILIGEGDLYKFTDDYLFNSPSTAASQVLAKNANRWIE